MAEFILKGGDNPPTEMINIIKENKDNYLRINIEVETPKERIQRAFHSLLNAWFKSGEFSHEVFTEKGLKRQYKIIGCQRETAYLEYRGEEFKNVDELLKAYPDCNPKAVTRQPRHWMNMTKEQQCRALDSMITEIQLSLTNDQEVLYKLALIQNDVEALKWLKWDKYQANKNGMFIGL